MKVLTTRHEKNRFLSAFPEVLMVVIHLLNFLFGSLVGGNVDTDEIMYVLNELELMLRNWHCHFADGSVFNLVALMVENNGGIEILESLLGHWHYDVQDRAQGILRIYFNNPVVLLSSPPPPETLLKVSGYYGPVKEEDELLPTGNCEDIRVVTGPHADREFDDEEVLCCELDTLTVTDTL